MSTTAAPLDLATAALTRSRKRRKRFLAAGIGGLAVLGASLGVSFLGPSGTTSLTVSAGGSSNLVFAVGTGGISGTLPSAVTTLKYGSTASAGVLPNWSNQIAVGSAGTVDTTSPDKAGDLALIDASQAPNNVILNIYVTNLFNLQQDYSSFAFKVNIYSCSSLCTTTGAWSQASLTGTTLPTYITNTEGMLSFTLPATGKYYDVTIDSGGSFYTIGTDTSGGTSGGSLSPSYYFTAQSS